MFCDILLSAATSDFFIIINILDPLHFMSMVSKKPLRPFQDLCRSLARRPQSNHYQSIPQCTMIKPYCQPNVLNLLIWPQIFANLFCLPSPAIRYRALPLSFVMRLQISIKNPTTFLAGLWVGSSGTLPERNQYINSCLIIYFL
jgi:hypothetical protein